MAVNLGMAHVSRDFMIVALLVYSLAVLAFEGDYAFGRPRRAKGGWNGGRSSVIYS